MKSKIATTLFSIVSVLGFSDELDIKQPSANLQIDLKATEKKLITKQSFSYVRMTVADPDLTTFQTLPGLGLGYRYGIKDSAIDVSANYIRESKGNNYSYTIPVSYLRYISNDAAPQSFYYGAGLGWAGAQNEIGYNNGLNVSLSAGYEMNRTSTVHSFAQLDVSHRAINVSTTSVNFQRAYLPTAQVSFGLGF